MKMFVAADLLVVGPAVVEQHQVILLSVPGKRGDICPGSRGEANILENILEVRLGDVLVGVVVHVLGEEILES